MGLKSGLLLFVLASLTLVISIAWFIPASVVWKQLASELTYPNELAISTPRGSLRKGTTAVRFRSFPTSTLSWQAQWPTLHQGDITFRYLASLQGANHELNAQLAVSLSTPRIEISELNGYVDSKDINQLAVAYGHQLEGKLTLSQGAMEITDRCLTFMTGDLHWDGGRIVFSTPNRVERYDLPDLSGLLKSQACGIEINVRRNQNDLARLALKPDGWFLAELQPALLSMAKITGADRLKTPLLFEEKIL